MDARERLIRAAVETFAENGFNATTRMLAAFAALVAAATREDDTRQCNRQAILLVGQVMVFRAGSATATRRPGMTGYTPAEVAEIQEAVVSRAMAALDFMAARRARSQDASA